MKCECEDWKTNIPTIDTTIVMASIRGSGCGVKPFNFCPYCNKKLTKEGI